MLWTVATLHVRDTLKLTAESTIRAKVSRSSPPSSVASAVVERLHIQDVLMLKATQLMR